MVLLCDTMIPHWFYPSLISFLHWYCLPIKRLSDSIRNPKITEELQLPEKPRKFLKAERHLHYMLNLPWTLFEPIRLTLLNANRI